MMSDRQFTRRMVQTVLTVIAAVIAVFALYIAREALMLIYVSAIVAMGFSPLVRMVERPRTASRRRRVPRTLAILAIYLTIIALLVVLGMMVVPPLVDQATDLWLRLPQKFNEFQRFLRRHQLTTHTVTLQEAVESAPAGSGGNAVGAVLSAIWRVVGGVFGVITILILSFYLLVESESLFGYLTRFVSKPRRAHLTAASREAVHKVSAWLGAQLILAAVMGVCAAVGLGLMRVPYFYVVALVAAIGETIPIVGPVIAGFTAIGIAITVSPKLALIVGLFFLGLHQLEANILVPKIMERRVGVSPVTVIIALLIGGALWGLMGAVLAIPTAAILSVFVEEFAGSADEGPDPAE